MWKIIIIRNLKNRVQFNERDELKGKLEGSWDLTLEELNKRDELKSKLKEMLVDKEILVKTHANSGGHGREMEIKNSFMQLPIIGDL